MQGEAWPPCWQWLAGGGAYLGLRWWAEPLHESRKRELWAEVPTTPRACRDGALNPYRGLPLSSLTGNRALGNQPLALIRVEALPAAQGCRVPGPGWVGLGVWLEWGPLAGTRKLREGGRGEGLARLAEVSRGAGAGCWERCWVGWGRLAK